MVEAQPKQKAVPMEALSSHYGSTAVSESSRGILASSSTEAILRRQRSKSLSCGGLAQYTDNSDVWACNSERVDGGRRLFQGLSDDEILSSKRVAADWFYL